RASATEEVLQSPTPQLLEAVLSPAVVEVAQPWSPQEAEADLSPAADELLQLDTPDRHMPRSDDRCPVLASVTEVEHSPKAPDDPQDAPAPSRPARAWSGAECPVASRSCSVSAYTRSRSAAKLA